MRKGIGLFTTLMVCMAMALCVSCKPDDNEPGGGTQTVATVTTNEVTEITQTTAVCGGEVMSENGWAVTERGVCWGTEPNPTPSDNCTVDGDGIGKFTSVITGLIHGTKYYVRAYAKNAAGTGFGAERSFTTGDHEYVDLGLPSGLLWATCNVGADSPGGYGDYYQWGGVTPVTSTSINIGWADCPFTNGTTYSSDNQNVFTKYIPKDKPEFWAGDGDPDNKLVLELSDDAARANWGGNWRMPTADDFNELKNNTNRIWKAANAEITIDGQTVSMPVAGYYCVSTKSGYTDRYIFLPAAGYRNGTSLSRAGSSGYCWSSSLYTSGPNLGRYLDFVSGDFGMSYIFRYYGFTVRPVCPPQN